MRTNLPILLLLLSGICYGQPPVDALINAEKNFAALAARTTTKGAFLYYLDSSSIVFDQGEILNGYAYWNHDPGDNSLLLWRPEVALLSASGDFGCTMGPSEYRSERTAETTGRFGHFASLWHRNAEGKWSVLCDIGVQHGDPAADDNRIVKRALQRTGSTRPDSAEAAAREGQLVEGIKAGRKNLLKEYSAPDAWILLAGRQPVRSREMDDFDESVPGHYLFEPPAGSWLSPAGDMRVSYGKTTANKKAANYMWVWIADRGKWQLMMMVMN